MLKELLDNALDATEHPQALEAYARTGDAPMVHVVWQPHPDPDLVQLTVVDNGVGISPATVQRILNFATRTSDKAVYRSPTRGAQGNALKTVLGIPWALGVRVPVVIEAQGLRHTITVSVDPAGNVHVQRDETPVPVQPGTRVTLTVRADQDGQPTDWPRAFALFNPHVSVKICQEPHPGLALLTAGVSLRRFLPSDRRLPRPLAEIPAWRSHVGLVV